MNNIYAKERPILFSAPMVRAILEGRKTQTRRVIKPQPDYVNPLGIAFWTGKGPVDYRLCPHGQEGDRLWVKETAIIAPKRFATPDRTCIPDSDGDLRYIQYIATCPDTEGAENYKLKKTPSIFMPRWASRITLEITGVRVERLNEISEVDAIAEGAEMCRHDSFHVDQYTCGYRSLWEAINGTGSWARNPWVWVIELRRVS